jgi:energy-coupling factor transporter ATP-binding protein EcfA2
VIKSLSIENFTVFPETILTFGSNLNVIVGENGAGKTHILKLAYSILAASAEEERKTKAKAPKRDALQRRLTEKLVNVFRPETLGRLARRRQGKTRADVAAKFKERGLDLSFSFANPSQEIQIDRLPKAFVDVAPAFLPTRELLTIYPGFVPLYENHYLEFEETWRDTCLLLGAPLKRGPTETRIKQLLPPLEEAMGGSIEIGKNGHFYLVIRNGWMEMPLVAEGLRKLGMLARLIATGALLDKGYLFWDEPEANLNPRIIQRIAKTVVELSKNGIQVFVATHSLFFLREIEMILEKEKLDARFFGLQFSEDGVVVEQGPTPEDMGAIAVLDEELAQSDRFLHDEVKR